MNIAHKLSTILLLTLILLLSSLQAYARQQLGINLVHPQEKAFTEQLEKAFSDRVSVRNFDDKASMIKMLTRFNQLDAVLISKETYRRHNSAALIPLTEVQISGEDSAGLVLATHSFLTKAQQEELLLGYQELLLSVNGLELLEFYATGKGALPFQPDDTPQPAPRQPKDPAPAAINQQPAGKKITPVTTSQQTTSSIPVAFKTGSRQTEAAPVKSVSSPPKTRGTDTTEPAEKPPVPEKAWRPHVDITGKLGNDKSLGELELFIPVAQRPDRLFFLDVRFQLDDNEATEGNFGIGMRKIIDNLWILGGYAFYDQRESTYNNDFNQVTVGVEALTEAYDARVNAYLAEDKDYLVARQESTDQVVFSGFNLVHQSGGPAFEIRERAMSGFDAELGWRLPWFDKPEIRNYVGGYHFTASGVEDISGPRGRVAIRFPDIFGWAGALFEIGGEIRHDSVRDTDYFISARGRIPFGSAAKSAHKPAGITARMTERIQRDPDIVVARQEKDTSTPLKNTILTDGDNEITITHVDSQSTGGDGSADTPFNTLADAETLSNDIVLLYANSTFDGEGITLNPNQRLLGENFQHTVSTDQLGEVSLPRVTKGTQAPVIENPSGSAVELGDASEVSGIAINNSNIGIYGSGVGGININRNRISSVGDGILMEDLAPNSATNMISGNTIVGADYDGISVYNTDTTGAVAIDITNNRVENLGLAIEYGSGIYIYNNGQELHTNITGNTITNSYDEGLLLENEAGIKTLTASVRGNQISTTGLEGMAFFNYGENMNLTVLDNQVQDVALTLDGTAFVNAGTNMNLYLQGNRVNGDIDSGFADYLLDNLAGTTFNLGATAGFPDTGTDTDQGIVAAEGNTRLDPAASPVVDAFGDFNIVDKATIPAL